MLRFNTRYIEQLNDTLGKEFRYGVIKVKTRNKQFISTTTGHEVKKTCLYDLHVNKQGKIINFAGWLLPVQYKETIAASHQYTRRYASLFDVGHMLQTQVTGKDATEFLESLTTADLENLNPSRATLTVFTNDDGGIVDDLIITKDRHDRYFLVSNAGRRDEDSRILLEKLEEFKRKGKTVGIKFLEPLEQGLIALQGPSSETALQTLIQTDLKKLKFMETIETMSRFDNEAIRISRCGYTGEDGFEISIPSKSICQFVEELLVNPEVKLAGLGARDSLRLEAGLCLYGHDIDENTSPIEAGLTWLVGKKRRKEGSFPGAERILTEIKLGPKIKRVGLTLAQGPPFREGAKILTPEGEPVGKITSGGPSPTLGKPIGMGYVPSDLAHFGGGVLIEIRNQTYKATITKMPFIPTHYCTRK